MDSSNDAEDFIDSYELDHIVSHFKVSQIDEIGRSLKWFEKTDQVSKLYRVAARESVVESTSTERVKNVLSFHSKFDDMVRELVTLGVWKDKVLPELLKVRPEPNQSFPTYVVIFYEVLVHGIVQAMIYHGDVFNYLRDTCDDLVEYCVVRLTQLVRTSELVSVDGSVEGDEPLENIKNQQNVVGFTVGSQCVATLRYIVENLNAVPLSVSTRIYSTHDVPILITHLLHRNVWTKKRGSKSFKFNETEWQEYLPDSPPLSKMECQVWLLLRQMLLNPTAQGSYQFSNYRKEQLTLLLKYLNDVVLDQMSVLVDLQRMLHLLQVRPPSDGDAAVHNPLIVEITPLFKDQLLHKYESKWEDVATNASRLLFYPDVEQTLTLAKSFSKSMEFLISIKDKLNSCSYCMKNAVNRCGKCKRAWYCSKYCQAQHWTIHKPLCSV